MLFILFLEKRGKTDEMAFSEQVNHESTNVERALTPAIISVTDRSHQKPIEEKKSTSRTSNSMRRYFDVLYKRVLATSREDPSRRQGRDLIQTAAPNPCHKFAASKSPNKSHQPRTSEPSK